MAPTCQLHFNSDTTSPKTLISLFFSLYYCSPDIFWYFSWSHLLFSVTYLFLSGQLDGIKHQEVFRFSVTVIPVSKIGPGPRHLLKKVLYKHWIIPQRRRFQRFIKSVRPGNYWDGSVVKGNCLQACCPEFIVGLIWWKEGMDTLKFFSDLQMHIML